VDGHLTALTFIYAANYEHPIAFNQGRIEGFNEGIEAAGSCFNPIFQIEPSAENIVLIMETFKKCFEEIEKLKTHTK
jgi:hypothetical protein